MQKSSSVFWTPKVYYYIKEAPKLISTILLCSSIAKVASTKLELGNNNTTQLREKETKM